MTSASGTDKGSFDPIKLACWAGICAYAVMKVVLLSRGATFKELFDFGDPSLWGLMVGACVMGLILRSPTMRQKATLIEANETRAVTLSFVTVFIVMAAYYFLRPVRDSMASDWTDAEISQLWTLQFFLSLGLVMVYGVACSKISFRLLVPAVYAFYAITFALFFFLASAFSDAFEVDLGFWAFTVDQTLLDKTFYMWVSLFSLFHLSVFWSFMADTYSQEQSKRVFAFIAAGASAGAAAGPLVVAVIANDVGNEVLMLLAAGLLMLAIPLVLYLQRLKVVDLHNEDVHANLAAAKMGGRWWAGFGDFFTNPYLMTIGVFILLYTGIQAFLYFEQTELLRIYAEREARTTVLSLRDGIVNILTFGLGLFITSRIVRRLGMPMALALLPLFATVALLILAMVPILVVFLAVDIARRSGEYGLTRPAREMLFTSVDRETRFKTKPVIDVAVYRAGDAWWGKVFSFLSEGIGLSYTVMSVIGAAIGAIWVAAAIYLGRTFNRRESRADEQAAAAEPKVLADHAAPKEPAAT